MTNQCRFALFGLGPVRRKLLYRDGSLRDALSGEVLEHWKVRAERWLPAQMLLELETDSGSVRLREDEAGVWLDRKGEPKLLTAGASLRLPRFEKHPKRELLCALHAELLLNLMPWGPVPNLWIYPRPWYRDAALVMMALERTGNVSLLEPWVMGLTQAYDRNNAGVEEPDNLGQALWMISRVSDRRHPLVPKVLELARERSHDGHLIGQSDFAEHPVFQTKWLKFGLAALGLDDAYRIPELADSYSALFWMGYRDEHVETAAFGEKNRSLYPYLAWAEAHFHAWPAPKLVAPTENVLTWEAEASQADYYRLREVDAKLFQARIGSPHTWHAAEMFLYYLDHPEG